MIGPHDFLRYVLNAGLDCRSIAERQSRNIRTQPLGPAGEIAEHHCISSRVEVAPERHVVAAKLSLVLQTIPQPAEARVEKQRHMREKQEKGHPIIAPPDMGQLVKEAGLLPGKGEIRPPWRQQN
jgi:hypothetical protein